MSEKRADELVKGDVLDLKGHPYTVLKVKVKKKVVRLWVDGRAGTFDSEVKARTLYRMVEPTVEGVPVADLDVPFENDRVLVERLGARLVGVERAGGRLVVPPVTDATVLGHLLTMHGRRFDGATVAEAKAWAKANPGRSESMQQVLDALSLRHAYELHDGLHKDLTAMPTPHWHEAVA